MKPGDKFGRYFILDADNRIVDVGDDVMRWGMFFEDGNRWVSYTQVTSEILVSTIFVGIDMRSWHEGPPMLFETMIFGGPLDDYQWRYSSWDDAEIGHSVAVKQARAAIGKSVKVEQS